MKEMENVDEFIRQYEMFVDRIQKGGTALYENRKVPVVSCEDVGGYLENGVLDIYFETHPDRGLIIHDKGSGQHIYSPNMEQLLMLMNGNACDECDDHMDD